MKSETPWYYNGYVWLVIGLPAFAVVVSFILLYVSIKYADTPVKQDDWVKVGLSVEATGKEPQEKLTGF